MWTTRLQQPRANANLKLPELGGAFMDHSGDWLSASLGIKSRSTFGITSRQARQVLMDIAPLQEGAVSDSLTDTSDGICARALKT